MVRILIFETNGGITPEIWKLQMAVVLDTSSLYLGMLFHRKVLKKHPTGEPIKSTWDISR